MALDPEARRLRKLSSGALADEAGALKQKTEAIKDEAIRRGLRKAEGEFWKLSLSPPGQSNRTDKARLLQVLGISESEFVARFCSPAQTDRRMTCTPTQAATNRGTAGGPPSHGRAAQAPRGQGRCGPGRRYSGLGVELEAAIKRFLAETNDNPKPLVWTTDPEKIMVDSACLGIRRVYDSDSTLIGSLDAFVRSDNGCRMPHRAARSGRFPRDHLP